MRATLTDIGGRRWQLLFDPTVYRSPTALIDLNGKRVRVEGQPTGDPDAILVTSLVTVP
jgi:hypothetical protein